MNESVISLFDDLSELIGQILRYELAIHPESAARLGPILEDHKILDGRIREESAKLKDE